MPSSRASRLTVEDKLRVAEQLDWLGVRWIEGGYPQANPKDEEFFRRAPADLVLTNAELVAFGSTRRPAGKVDVDPTLAALVGGRAPPPSASWARAGDFHVTEALRTTLDEGVAMVGESVAFLAGEGLRVFLDLEHFFDGYKANPEYALRVLEAAVVNGAETVVLCDTNGGSLPHEVQRITGDVVRFVGAGAGVGHPHPERLGLRGGQTPWPPWWRGATQVQGTVNGYGERTGNANLMTVVPDLTLKLGVATLPEGHLERLTVVSHRVAELVNLPPHPADPFVGASAFAHKGGLHTSALGRAGGATYEHVDPAVVGKPHPGAGLRPRWPGRHGHEGRGVRRGARRPGRRHVVRGAQADGGGGLAVRGGRRLARAADAPGGRLAARLLRGRGLPGVELPPGGPGDARRPRGGQHRGHGEAVGRRRAPGGGGGGQRAGQRPRLGRPPGPGWTVPRPRPHPPHRPSRSGWFDGGAATGAVVRVLVDSTDGERVWTTVGVDSNVIEASWQALVDLARVRPAARRRVACRRWLHPTTCRPPPTSSRACTSRRRGRPDSWLADRARRARRRAAVGPPDGQPRPPTSATP